jgi:hypothetical protein
MSVATCGALVGEADPDIASLIRATLASLVMPALVAGIHVFSFSAWQTKDVDGRNKSGHDGETLPKLTKWVSVVTSPACAPLT